MNDSQLKVKAENALRMRLNNHDRRFVESVIKEESLSAEQRKTLKNIVKRADSLRSYAQSFFKDKKTSYYRNSLRHP